MCLPLKERLVFLGECPPQPHSCGGSFGLCPWLVSPTVKKPEFGGHCCLDTTLGPPSGGAVKLWCPPEALPQEPPTVRSLGPPSPVQFFLPFS